MMDYYGDDDNEREYMKDVESEDKEYGMNGMIDDAYTAFVNSQPFVDIVTNNNNHDKDADEGSFESPIPVIRIDNIEDEMMFLRDFVACNKPCIIDGLLDDLNSNDKAKSKKNKGSKTRAMMKSRLERRRAACKNGKVILLSDKLSEIKIIGSDKDERAMTRRINREQESSDDTILNKNVNDFSRVMKYWHDDEYLISSCKDKNGKDIELNINATPNGRADSVIMNDKTGEYVFAKPENRLMTMKDFLCEMRERNKNEVLYLSYQNDNLRQEFSRTRLIKDANHGRGFDFAKRVFGSRSVEHDEEAKQGQPEAANIWIGDERSVTSMHSDFYENLYAVVQGEKVFHLAPPVAIPFCGIQDYPDGNYTYNKEKKEWRIEMDENKLTTPWTRVDPAFLDESCEIHKEFNIAKRFFLPPIKVPRGKVLYIPFRWLHRVTQTRFTIALNYWYDVPYSLKHVYQDAWETLITLSIRPLPSSDLDDDDDDDKNDDEEEEEHKGQ